MKRVIYAIIKFVEICKSIDPSPKYQYHLIQIVLQLDPDLVKAQK